MLNLFERLFARSNTSDTNIAQSEREAIIDLLLLGVYADNHISLDENQILEESIDGLGWESGTGLSIYLNSATTKVRDALTDEIAMNTLLDAIAVRITSTKAKEQALSLLSLVFDADGKDVTEEAFYKEVASKLEAAS